MTTIVNTPPQSTNNSDSGMGMIVGLILLLAVVALFFVYGLPLLRRATAAPQVNVPDKIDVNVNAPNSEGSR